MRIEPDAATSESGFLIAFDSNRDLICAAAAKLYVRGSRCAYRKSNPGILVVQSAQDRAAENASNFLGGA